MSQQTFDNKEAKSLKEFTETGRTLTYHKQAIFFLNAMWKEHKDNAEEIWNIVHTMYELDLKNGEEGYSLDEFQSARLLEKFGKPMTVLERRACLKEIDVDTDNRMSFLEYAVWQYKVGIDEMMSRPQGTNVELEKAEEAVQKVQEEIKSIESKKKKLQEKAKGTGVKAKSAQNELEQLLSKDQTELNRRILTAEAALRRAQKSGNLAAPGKGWWLSREVEEAKKYKPKGNLKNKN